MIDLGVALGLVLVIEGTLYALFPSTMKRMMVQALGLPTRVLSTAGVIAALVGLVLVWVLRGGFSGPG